MWATPYTTKEEAASIKKFYAYMSEKGYVEKENGKFRIEGKEYLMQDGDICHFRFNL